MALSSILRVIVFLCTILSYATPSLALNPKVKEVCFSCKCLMPYKVFPNGQKAPPYRQEKYEYNNIIERADELRCSTVVEKFPEIQPDLLRLDSVKLCPHVQECMKTLHNKTLSTTVAQFIFFEAFAGFLAYNDIYPLPTLAWASFFAGLGVLTMSSNSVEHQAMALTLRDKKAELIFIIEDIQYLIKYGKRRAQRGKFKQSKSEDE